MPLAAAYFGNGALEFYSVKIIFGFDVERSIRYVRQICEVHPLGSLFEHCVGSGNSRRDYFFKLGAGISGYYLHRRRGHKSFEKAVPRRHFRVAYKRVRRFVVRAAHIQRIGYVFFSAADVSQPIIIAVVHSFFVQHGDGKRKFFFTFRFFERNIERNVAAVRVPYACVFAVDFHFYALGGRGVGTSVKREFFDIRLLRESHFETVLLPLRKRLSRVYAVVALPLLARDRGINTVRRGRNGKTAYF